MIVAPLASITLAPSGTVSEPVAPTAVMVSPSITTSWPATGVPPLPSISEPFVMCSVLAICSHLPLCGVVRSLATPVVAVSTSVPCCET